MSDLPALAFSLPAVPQFARLDEYFGCWAYEPERFVSLLSLFQGTDLTRHARETPRPQPSQATATDAVKVGSKTVALVRVAGTLMKQQSSMGGGTSTVMLRRDIRAAAADPNVSSILLAIDSPGGTVAGLADLAADVKAARRKKPIWAQVEDLAASAAYWVASQADAVFANSPTALVGSIGTVMTVYDTSAAAEREGVKAVVFSTGPLKGAGAPGTEVTDEQRAYFQGIVDDTQASFDAAVRAGRNLSAAQLAAVKTGGVWLAPRAKELGLIDGVRPIESTLTELASQK